MVQIQSEISNIPLDSGAITDTKTTSNTLPSTPSMPSPMSSLTQTSIEPLCGTPAFHFECQTNTLSLINENPPVLEQSVDNFNLHPELLNRIPNSNSNTESLTNPFTQSSLDQHTESEIESVNVLDNMHSFPAENVCSITLKPRTRNDSTESVDTVESSSSDEIFNSAYTDTVSSTTSTAFLIKSSSDSEMVSEACCNEGYMSSSSTEVLDEAGSQDSLLPAKKEEDSESETTPMLPGNENEQVLINIITENIAGQNLNDFVHHPLTPILENHIVSFEVEEIEPQPFTKITDNIIVADESFLFNSASNLGELNFSKRRERAATMQNIHERSSFLDLTDVSRIGRACQRALAHINDNANFGSLASLNTIAARDIPKDPMQSVSLISDGKSEGVLKNSNYMKNLIGLSLCITLLYIAAGSVRNLQSSINHEGGVGVIALSVNFISYMIGSIFSSSIVQRFQPRKCIIVNLFPNLLYIAANLYPTMWVMVPISFIQGVSLAITSNATSTYITFLAKGCSDKTKEIFAQVSGRYFGTFWLIYQSHIIIGNLIASLILEPPSNTLEPKPLVNFVNTTDGILSNDSTPFLNSSSDFNETPRNMSHLALCGPNFCQHFDIGGSRFAVPLETKYLLFGVYIGCIVLALLTAIFLMEPLNNQLFKSTISPYQQLKTQMKSLTLMLVNAKFLLMLPLLMYSSMQFAFVSAEFIKGYVTCPIGIHMIGYTMICFGICSSASSYFCGLLSKYTGRIPFIITAVILNLGCLIYMLQWQPVPGSLTPFFVIMGIWGISDGFWNTQVNSLMGVIFPDKFEEAYAGLRMLQGLSVSIAFGYSSVLCMTIKIFITFAVCFIGLVGYLVMEGTVRCRRTKPSLLLKVTSV